MDRNEMLAAEAGKILKAAREKELPLCLLGGLAVYFTCPSARETPFRREIADIDLIIKKRSSTEFSKLLELLGYTGDKQFNSIHGETRMLFSSDQTDVDVFIGTFQQCHTLELEDIISTNDTLPLSLLLLTKLQIVQINRKDELDALALLKDHEVKSGGEIDIKDIIAVTSNNWGWHTTVSDNLEKLAVNCNDIAPNDSELLRMQIATLQDAMRDCPKSMKWKLRDKLGRKVIWYDLPEEKVL